MVGVTRSRGKEKHPVVSEDLPSRKIETHSEESDVVTPWIIYGLYLIPTGTMPRQV